MVHNFAWGLLAGVSWPCIDGVGWSVFPDLNLTTFQSFHAILGSKSFNGSNFVCRGWRRIFDFWIGNVLVRKPLDEENQTPASSKASAKREWHTTERLRKVVG